MICNDSTFDQCGSNGFARYAVVEYTQAEVSEKKTWSHVHVY